MTTTTGTHEHLTMRDRVHVPRTRGATTGFLLVLLGLWGGLVPFIGPYFDYAFTPGDHWDLTWGRFWLEVLPAAATFLGGLSLLGSANRISASTGAWLGVAGGAWLVLGRTISQLWNDGTPAAGHPTSTSDIGITFQYVGFFYGLGAVTLFLAAVALGRLSVVGVRDVRAARARDLRDDEPVADAQPTHRGQTGS